MTLFEKIRTDIEEDVANGLNIELRTDPSGGLLVYDGGELVDREYRIEDPDKINADWIRERIIVTPSVSKLPYQVDVEAVAAWISEVIDPTMLMTLQNIVFVNDTEEDFDFLYNYNEDFSCEVETNSLPDENVFGILWYASSRVFINVGAVLKYVLRMISEGYIHSSETFSEFNFGIGTTIAHELRHLAQANPYFPEELPITEQRKAAEDDAEQYAMKTWMMHPAILTRSDKR